MCRQELDCYLLDNNGFVVLSENQGEVSGARSVPKTIKCVSDRGRIIPNEHIGIDYTQEMHHCNVIAKCHNHVTVKGQS